MIINDILYGSFDVNEPVLEELIASYEIQRLKGISAGGYYPAWPDMKREQFNRYHHSIGVFLLLRKFGCSLEEQIAGLIHDVSHTAFSHTVDYIKQDLLQQKSQGYQDSVHDKFVKNSSLAEIMVRHGFDLDYILDDNHFSLKENDLPNICADRIDYSLRQGFDLGHLSVAEKDEILDNLTNYNGSFVFKNFETAQKFAHFFWEMDSDQWSGMKTAVMFTYSSQLFRIAIESGYVKFEDFYSKNDGQIIDVIYKHKKQDTRLAYLDELLHLKETEFENNPENTENKIFCKIRRIDPCFINDKGRLERVSQRDLEFAQNLAALPKFITYAVFPKETGKTIAAE